MVLLDYINEFEGIIGAVLGSVSTLIVTDFIKRRGKLNIFVFNREYSFDTYGSVRCSQQGKEDNDLYGFSLKYKLHIYNSSDIPRIMRDFQIIIYLDNRIIHRLIPKDETTRVYKTHYFTVDEAGIVNINSREAIELEQSIYIHEEDMQTTQFNKIDLCYINDKNNMITVNLYNGLIAFNQNKNPDFTPIQEQI